MYRILLPILAAAAALVAPADAQATSFLFTGTRTHFNVPPVTGDGRCGADRNTIVIAPGTISASGTSNFGNFAPTQSHCITPPFPNTTDSGIFNWAFEDGGTLFGTIPVPPRSQTRRGRWTSSKTRS